MADASPLSTLPHLRLRRNLDYLSSRVPDPLNKLWFIKTTLERYRGTPAPLQRLPFVRSLAFYYVVLGALVELIWNPRAGPLSLPTGPILLLYRLRHPLLATIVAAAAYLGFRGGQIAYRSGERGADWVMAQLIPVPAAASDLPSSPLASYPTERLSAAPERVWLVEQEEGEELWSNGLRIVTSYQREGTARNFVAFPKDGSPPVPMGPKPVGIVYHTSESDMAPMSPEFSRDILSTTRDLIGWLSRREIYHYMIDRFGQVYRIVDDESVAVHAGVSIWADEENHFLNLNDSFIGIAFESQWKFGREMITSAQLQAAVNLTDLLRSRYQIADANCVPHGLVSVNPQKRLIGYHSDWAQDFPFGALGLTNKYELPPPSMTAFGFGYDEHLLDNLGGRLWKGVELAERDLSKRAEAQGIPLATLRSRLQQDYRAKIDLNKIMRRP